MSSDGEPINDAVEVSDDEQNEILVIGEDLQGIPGEETEEVQREEAAEAEGGGENTEGEKKTVKPKRIVRNPQPKLNEETLKGSRGIAALESNFERVKFKGKGKEQQDLDVIIKTYEYWCHRLFPKFPFDTCIERLEKLGTKRAVQTHIKRIRFNLLLEDKPIIDSSDEEPNVEGFVDIQNNEINQQQNQQFDELLGSSIPAPVQTPVDLTEEQLKRIQLNKERAEKLKQERLKKIRDKAEGNLQVSSQLPGTSGLQNETELEPSKPAELTQSDIFGQEDHISALESHKSNQHTLDEIENTETVFDLESNVKGKSNVTGTRIKKKANKRTFVLDDSDSSDAENFCGNIHNTDEFSNNGGSGNTELLDINRKSSEGKFSGKKENKPNIFFDSDDDDQMDGNKTLISRSQNSELNANPNLDNGNSMAKNISYKTLPKNINFLDSDESDQETGENNQLSKEISIAE